MCCYVIYQTIPYEHLKPKSMLPVLVVCLCHFLTHKKHKANRNEGDFFRKLLKHWHFSTQNSNKMGAQCFLFLMIICVVIFYKKSRYSAYFFHVPYIIFSDTFEKGYSRARKPSKFSSYTSFNNKYIFIFEKLFDYPH